MKYSLLVVALFAFNSLTSYADTKKPAMAERGGQLTAEQRVKIQQIRQEQKVKMEALRAETEAKMRTVLTPEQATKMQQMRGKFKDRKTKE